jgi:hypothetical protein
LVKTNNIDVATVIADELYNTYILAKENQKAYDLARKVLKKILNFMLMIVLALKQVKIAIDEILMREGKIDPSMVAQKYYGSKILEAKSFASRIVKFEQTKKYNDIHRMKNIYNKISNTITKRFGYKNIAEVFDTINAKMINFI